jgi:Fur family ferric uptake transcriptional regulator
MKYAIFNQHNIKSTAPRIAIYKILQESKTPLTIVEIITELRAKFVAVDRATVFRIMNTFSTKGLVYKLEFGEGKARYELASLSHHHHLVCTSCGMIKDIKKCGIDSYSDELAKDTGFAIANHRVEFFGLCSKCK